MNSLQSFILTHGTKYHMIKPEKDNTSSNTLGSQANRRFHRIRQQFKRGNGIRFFNNLAKWSTDCQIIVFDNKTPPEDLREITYHHFTENPDSDRTGFIAIR